MAQAKSRPDDTVNEQPATEPYFFPEQGVTIQATSKAEAEEGLDKELKKRKATSKDTSDDTANTNGGDA